MDSMLVYPAGSTPACQWAARYLANQGIATVDHPTPDATHLLLDVPSLAPDGSLRGGGSLNALLRMLPANITILGGNLSSQAALDLPVIDLMQDAQYVAKNAAITADCALRVAGQHLNISYIGCPALVIGWGRIGKILAGFLRSLGADVTIAARNPADRAMALALGYQVMEISKLDQEAKGFRLIFNTVPAMVLTAPCPNCICIELASQPGMEGDNIITARGLPGIMTPESSGALICESFLRIVGRK